MYDLFVGCDISKSEIDVAYYENKPMYTGQFTNDVDGFKMMVEHLEETTGIDSSNWFVCFENTGVYSKALAEWLTSREIAFREENALQVKKSLGIRRGKNDKSDAEFLCRYGYEKRDSLEVTKLCNPVTKKVKRLLSRRDLLVKKKKALSVSVSETKAYDDPDIAKMFAEQNEEILRMLSRQIKEIERKVKAIYKENKELQESDKLAQSVIGIGPVISAYFIVITDNFTRFGSARKCASYVGVAPFLHGQSGTKKGQQRVSHMANKKMKSLLGMAVRAAIQHDPQIRVYYERKIAEGKPRGLVLNNLKNKLIQRVFSTIKRGTPYVKIMDYA